MHRCFKPWSRWVFLCLLVIWQLSEGQRSSFLIGAFEWKYKQNCLACIQPSLFTHGTLTIHSFEERLVAQRKEREMATAELGFKKPLSKEERTEKKKQRLAAIGTFYFVSVHIYICTVILHALCNQILNNAMTSSIDNTCIWLLFV